MSTTQKTPSSIGTIIKIKKPPDCQLQLQLSPINDDTLGVRLLAIGTPLCPRFGLWLSSCLGSSCLDSLGSFVPLALLGKDYTDVLQNILSRLHGLQSIAIGLQGDGLVTSW